MSNPDITVLYVDEDLARVAGTARQLQDTDPGIAIRHTGYWEDAAGLLRNGEANVVLFGLRADGSGCDDLQRLHEAWPEAVILATGAVNDLDLVKRCVASGARLFIPTTLKASKVCAILRQQAEKQP